MEITPGIHWVGAVDWDIREFHGYITQRGSSYNAYLIMDEKVVLIDTVKKHLYPQMLDEIKRIVDPAKIDIIVSNHVEMDHSGSLPKLLELCPNATVVTSTSGEKGLRRHFKKDWKFKAVHSGESLSIGKRTLHFHHTPMVHWPDNMVTYCPEERILFSNDAFGQHIASHGRYEENIGWDVVREEAAKYYANIVMPYGPQVEKALSALGGLDIQLIAPSHGVMWRRDIPRILAEYKEWAAYRTKPKALIVYDSMWGSTELMAHALKRGLISAGADVTVRSLKSTHISDVVADVLESRLVLLGSPTLNNGMLPTMGWLLTYLKGLKPKGRVGFAFSSYGWGGQSLPQLEEAMKEMGWTLPVPGVRYSYIPDEAELQKLEGVGVELAKSLKKEA